MNSISSGHCVILSGSTPWSSSGPIAAPKPRAVRGSKSRVSAREKESVVYPVFETAILSTTDPYWRELFLNASRGNFPRGFKYHSGVLTHRVRTKTTEVALSDLDHDNFFRAAKNFFSEKGSLASDLDLEEQHKREETIQIAANSGLDTWAKIKGHRARQIVIAFYVDKLGNKLKLTVKERSALNSLIWIGILAGYFNNKTIVITDGKISKIDGLIENIYRNEDGSISYEFVIDVEEVKDTAKKNRQYFDNEEDLSHSLSLGSGQESIGIEDDSKPTGVKNWMKFLNDWSKKPEFRTSSVVPIIDDKLE